MAGLTWEERQQALTCAANGADFMFEPSPFLCSLLTVGSPETEGINSIMVAILLAREPIRLDTSTVVKYCRGTLDSKNTWLLDHGDIRVVPPRYKKPEITKAMADEDEENGANKRIYLSDLLEEKEND